MLFSRSYRMIGNNLKLSRFNLSQTQYLSCRLTEVSFTPANTR